MATLVPNLVVSSMLGVGVPKFAWGLGLGLSTWTPTILIGTTDVGTAGVGKGVPIPIVIPQPLLYGNLLAGMVAQGLVGVSAPAFILGLTNGLVLLYAQALTNTAHMGVGTGAGVATFRPPPAFPSIQAGFAAVGMVGVVDAKFARALSQGLERTFRLLVLPQPIVGPTTPTGASGRGFGSIL
jgi:hypothetical protein